MGCVAWVWGVETARVASLEAFKAVAVMFLFLRRWLPDWVIGVAVRVQDLPVSGSLQLSRL